MVFVLTSVSGRVSTILRKKGPKAKTRGEASGGAKMGTRARRRKGVQVQGMGRSGKTIHSRWPHTCIHACEQIIVGGNENFLYLDPLTETCPHKYLDGQSPWYTRRYNEMPKYRRQNCQEILEKGCGLRIDGGGR